MHLLLEQEEAAQVWWNSYPLQCSDKQRASLKRFSRSFIPGPNETDKSYHGYSISTIFKSVGSFPNS